MSGNIVTYDMMLHLKLCCFRMQLVLKDCYATLMPTIFDIALICSGHRRRRRWYTCKVMQTEQASKMTPVCMNVPTVQYVPKVQPSVNCVLINILYKCEWQVL